MISQLKTIIPPPVAVTLLTITVATLQAQNTVEKVLVGDTKVTVLQSYKGTDTLSKPAQIVVHDFDIPSEVITIDRSPAAHILGHSPIARMKGDAGENENPAAVATKVQAAFSKTLLNELKKTSIPSVQSALGANPESPVSTLIIRGDFTSVKQGNKTARVMIGLGRGASDVQAHVAVSLITPDGPVLLSEFKVNSQSGKKPGAAETMGVGGVATAAGTSAATDSKSDVEGDTSRMAKAVARQIQSVMTTQKWIAAPASPPAAQSTQ